MFYVLKSNGGKHLLTVTTHKNWIYLQIVPRLYFRVYILMISYARTDDIYFQINVALQLKNIDNNLLIIYFTQIN